MTTKEMIPWICPYCEHTADTEADLWVHVKCQHVNCGDVDVREAWRRVYLPPPPPPPAQRAI